jgi:hypothetical protein
MSDLPMPLPAKSKLAHWLDQVDAWADRIGSSFNPILVKETRQALKSRQFVITFSVLLFAALAWTIIGSLSMMPRIYSTPSAPRMLIGYYLVLALPMLLVVPLAAYRSLEGEIDDGTLELLSITTLSPWQIVLGKLASAMLQMLLYFVALFPCVAYAYTLRGVDLPTTVLMIGTLLVAAILLTILALFFAPLAQSRTGRICTLLVVMLILLGAEWGLGAMLIMMIVDGNPLSSEQLFFVIIATVTLAISAGHLLLTATAVQLTPESENRSTRIRLSVMILSAILVGLSVLALRMLPGDQGVVTAMLGVMALAGLWTFCGSMMAAESPIMTPRIRRELPSSFAARAILTWLTPGPVTGLVFATANIVLLTVLVLYGIDYAADLPNVRGLAFMADRFRLFCIAYAGYLVCFLVAIRFVIGVIRINNHPRVELGLAALVAVAVLSSLVPYSIGLQWNDYVPFAYNNWQITNWAWTLSEILNGAPLDTTVAWIVVSAVVGFFVAVLTMPQLVLPRRIATPKRVEEELAAKL